MTEKPLLYLLAGNGGAANWWEDVTPLFSCYQAQPLELPGFGDNPSPPCADISAYVEALLSATQAGSAIVAVGVNALLVLHALQRRPGHFSRTILLAPVGVYLWQRRLPALMSWPPLRRLAYWLLVHKPHWFARKFSAQDWQPEQYRRMGEGYRRCRAFLPYWDMFRPDNALALLEWVQDPIELVWGACDGVLEQGHAAAWSAVLARADLRVSLMPTWGHYPWIDQPREFVAWLESGIQGFVAHGKGGRLQLAALAGLPVPPALTVRSASDSRIQGLLEQYPNALWAVRSSSYAEDQADQSNAGLSQTFLRLSAAEVPSHVSALRNTGVEEVVVQRFVQPLVSGIAFVRHLAAEVEWVSGHLEALADGRATPQRAILSRLGGAWSEGTFQSNAGLSAKALWRFLQATLHAFHYVHGDIEWAWDGQQLWLLQYRPVTDYGWRRYLTAANISEILPPQPSRLVDYVLHHGANSIPAVMARWDARVLQDNEPFTARFDGALYINNDYALARLRDWGVPFSRYTGQVGGAAPHLPWQAWRLLLSLSRLWRMQRHSRQALGKLEHGLRQFDAELDALMKKGVDGQTLADWGVRFQVFAVQGNICIATALSSNVGAFFGQPETVYRHLSKVPHRLPWETDPATARDRAPFLPQQPFPSWPHAIRLAHHLCFPGLRGYYLQVREWYRDNLMRIFFKVHHAMPVSERAYWFAPVEASRTRRDSFWQDGYVSGEKASGFVIYPGEVQGVLGQDILLEESLDPGRYAQYQAARAVVSRMGGRLSHGATLLRELRKPAAVIPDINAHWLGQRVTYRDGKISLCAANVSSD